MYALPQWVRLPCWLDGSGVATHCVKLLGMVWDYRGMFYDIDGNEITEITVFEGLLRRKRTEGYGRIGSDTIDGARVSTVWIGNNYNFTMQGPPIIFETMVFGAVAGHEDWDEYTQRYSTKEQAAAGHAEIVELVRREIELASVQVDGQPDGDAEQQPGRTGCDRSE